MYHLDFSYGIQNRVKILEKNNVLIDKYIYTIKKNKKWIMVDKNSKNNYDYENKTKKAHELLEIGDNEKFNWNRNERQKKENAIFNICWINDFIKK